MKLQGNVWLEIGDLRPDSDDESRKFLFNWNE